jgi:NDP-sugar pyrophosphorylase family protein
MLPCFVLAGGLGKRLREISGDNPKTMMEVGGRPFLEYQILQLKNQGFADIVLCTGYRSEVLERYFGSGEQLGVQLRYSRETEPLGTGGALKRALALTSSPHVIALNGDSLVEADLASLIQLHVGRGAAATIALAHVDDAYRFGRVEIDEQGVVTRFSEKGATGPGWINAGLYILSRSVLEGIPDGMVSIEHEVFPHLLGGKPGLLAKPFPGFFIDMGIPSDYQKLANDTGYLKNRFAGSTVLGPSPLSKESSC